MKFPKILLAAAFSSVLLAPANAQWQGPTNAVPIGQGGGVNGFVFVGPGTNSQALFGNTGTAPGFRQPAFTDITGTIASSQVSSSIFANPSATIGLTAVNGSSTLAMRSDGAPALSQAIAPTWTGLHTFTATAGGIKLLGAPNITTGYQETSSLFGAAFDLTTVSTTTPETAVLINTTNSVGSANLISAFKRSLSVTNECNSGSADCWGQTNAIQISNGGTQRGGVGLEIDMNNFFGNFTGVPTSPYAANIILTGQNNDGAGHGGYAACAICISFAQNASPMWNYGIVLGTGGFQVFNTASIQDLSNSPISFAVGGAHNEGIDLSTGTYSVGAFVLGNNQALGIKDSGGTLRNGLTLSASNVFVLGDTLHDTSIGPHIRVAGSTPTVTSGCGTSPSISGSDLSGRIVLGASPTNTCTITWAGSYNSAPSCTFTDNNLMSIAISATPSTTGFVIGNASGAAAGGHTVSWTCAALSGG